MATVLRISSYHRRFSAFVSTVCGAILCGMLPAPAAAQPSELRYDDGTPAGMLDIAPQDIEMTRFTPLHPATVTAVRLYFAQAAGCVAQIRIWADNGANQPDLDQVLYQSAVTVDATGWLEVQIDADAVVLDPPNHFHVGHILGDPACQVAWDASGADEGRSMAHTDGTWFYIGDGGTPSKPIDALIRATVDYFDVITERHFKETTAEAGLFDGMRRVAWGDYDNDGHDDLLVSGKRLFRNEGDGTFIEVTASAGIGDSSANGGVWADYDNDGFLDFYATVNNYLPACNDSSDCVWCTVQVTGDGIAECVEYHHDHSCEGGFCMPPEGVRHHDRLWQNNGDGTFSDVSEIAGRPYDFLPSEAAAWADYDNDGYVDLFVANYETPRSWNEGGLSRGNPDFLWQNNGDGTFSDVSEQAGLRAFPEQCGRGAAWADYDNDGDTDLYVANYRLDFNFLWQNNGDGTFENVSGDTHTAGEMISGSFGHSIGAGWADFDNDEDWDLFVANLAHPRFIEFSDQSMLYVNSGPPDFVFADIRESAQIAYSETHSDPAWGDYDNDGWVDLFITDVYVGYRAFLYKNNGDTTFADATYPAGIDLDNGWGCAWADYDNDGRLDLVSRKLWKNNVANMNHWLKVKLHGVQSNRAAIGARVIAEAGGRIMQRQVEGGRGTGNQSSLTLHFGLGSADKAESIIVVWPSGRQDSHLDVAADQTVTYWEGDQVPTDGGSDSGSLADGSVDSQNASPSTTGGSGCGCRTQPLRGESVATLHAALGWIFIVLLLCGLRRRPRR
jgi:hypothetical protein